ncbi:MAG: sterol desaturase family protein [Gammaproteobacteria bacterium]|nr:sterol desaturase family protein [Gammaproteobacteria bacterium]
MEAWILQHEPAIRLTAFAAVLLTVGLAERLWPRRPAGDPRLRRWLINLTIMALGTALLRLAVPVLAVGAALAAREAGWGLFNRLPLPAGVELAAAVLLLDLAIYGQHRYMHASPLFWRLHRMHHSDLDFDTSTGVRFHPLEIVVSMAYKIAVVTALGASAPAVVAFELLLNATSLFNHGNLRIPPSADRWLRLLVVTPDMHRVHHSVHRHETDSNFGFNFPWWDRAFRTYRAQPRDGHGGMAIGLPQFRAARDQTLWRLLAQPAAQ